MGDAAGQAADRLHLLRLPQFILELPALGNIHHQAAELLHSSMRVLDDVNHRPEPDRAGVGRDGTVLEAGVPAPRGGLSEQRQRPLTIVRMNVSFEELGVGEPERDGVTEDRLGAVAHEREPPRRVRLPHDGVEILHKTRESALGGGGLGASHDFAGREVAVFADDLPVEPDLLAHEAHEDHAEADRARQARDVPGQPVAKRPEEKPGESEEPDKRGERKVRGKHVSVLPGSPLPSGRQRPDAGEPGAERAGQDRKRGEAAGLHDE